MRLCGVRYFTVVGLLACLAALASCGRRDGEMELFRTSGELFYQGQPAVGARLAFWPEQEEPIDRWPSGYPRAIVDEHGKFVVETLAPEDGCPPGEYTLLVTWPAAPDGSEHGDSETIDRLGGRYAIRESSTLKAKVEARPTELGRYDIP